ncbi:MAG: hypothetical protein HY323_08120 [Betaproteobacteria bacterium]|nr:hypothetical protein [Betaproteobacteria bacterium]
MTLSAGIAGRLGRPNLNRTSALTSADRESANGTAGPWLSAGAGGEVGLGRLSAGVGGMIVIGLVLFYVWTRAHQG